MKPWKIKKEAAIKAVERNAAGEKFTDIAIDMNVDIATLRRALRHYGLRNETYKDRVPKVVAQAPVQESVSNDYLSRRWI